MENSFVIRRALRAPAKWGLESGCSYPASMKQHTQVK
ncbi:hypothetical protein LINPERPRIM_LOCUS17602 [Linum perenne]